MNRRAFLRFLTASMVVGPAVITQGVTDAGAWSVDWPWVATQWLEKEFDSGSAIGFAVEIANRETGETRRNAVRLHCPRAMRTQPGWYADARALAKNVLYAWAEESTGQAIVWPRS